jgi:hypothetical protein
VSKCDSFTPDNDPYEEHDFGKIEVSEHVIFWKIDYYDVDLSMHSPDGGHSACGPCSPFFASRPEQLMRGFGQKIPLHHQLADL